MGLWLGLGLVLTLLPASFVLLAAGRILPVDDGNRQPGRGWALFLLAAAAALAVPFAIFSASLFTDWGSLVALLFLPALVAVLALLAINWRSIAALWRTDRLLAGGLLALLLLLLLTTMRSQPAFLVVLLVGSLGAAAVWWALRRLEGGALLAAGGLSCLLLLVDATGLASTPQLYDHPVLLSIYRFCGLLVPFLAVACAALLVRGSVLAPQIEGGRGRPRRLPSLLLAGLIVLSLAAAVYRSALMVNATGRAFEDHLPFLTVLAAVAAGLLLALTSSSRRGAWTGIAYAAVVSLILILAYSLGWQVDPHVVTVQRAQGIAGALREYHREHGAYPDSLDALTPGYLTVLLGPLNGRGQRWCYQAQGDRYRLAYVLYRRYWDPDQFYKIELISTDGEPLEGTWMCDAELNRMSDTGGL